MNDKNLDSFLTNYTLGITQVNFFGITYAFGASGAEGATAFSYKEIITIKVVPKTT